MFRVTSAPIRDTNRRGRVQTTTLLALVSELVDAGGSDREVVTAVLELVETGRVRLVGQIRESDLLRAHS